MVYFAGWLLLSFLLNKWSAREDREGGMVPHGKLATISAPGLIFWAFTITFMAIDWLLVDQSALFRRFSDCLVLAGQGLSSMAFLIALMVGLSARAPMNAVLTHRHLHDLGKFLLALTMVWAYFSYSQFLIIWAGNLPEEIPWYLTRLRNGWQYVAVLLVIGHFALPFALLLSRDIKRISAAARHRDLHPVHAAGGSVLGGRAGLPQGRFRHQLDGFRCSGGAFRHLAGVLLPANWRSVR